MSPAMSTARKPRILVVGCGGIGGTVAASLTYAGHDVTPLTKNELIADAINTYGFRTRGEQSLGDVPARAVHELGKDVGPFDYVLLCTQPPQVEDAARSVVDRLAENGAMVVFQNGLCEPRIAEIAGSHRVIGGIIAWGASMIEPGIYDRTSSGGFTLGRIEGPPDERVRELEMLLEVMGPVVVTDNLMGARWSKLAINCAISSMGAIGGDRLGVLLRKRFVRRLALEIMSETVEVARAENVRLEKVSGTVDLDWIALTEDERAAALGSPGLFAKHALLLAVGTRYRRLRSSMLNAIERGRPAGVEFLNGEIVEHGKRHGIGTPINAAVMDEVTRIVAGKSRPSHDTLAALFQRTREPRVAEAAPVAGAVVETPAEPEAPVEEPSASTALLESTLPSPDAPPAPATVEPQIVGMEVEAPVPAPEPPPPAPEPPPPAPEPPPPAPEPPPPAPEPPEPPPAEHTPNAAESEPVAEPPEAPQDQPYFPDPNEG